MPWRPEDWSEWPVDRWPASPAVAAHVRALHDILRWLPDRARRRVAELTLDPRTPCPFLATYSSSVIPMDPTTGLFDPSVFPRRCDLAVAVDSIVAPSERELGLILQRISAALVEGGVLLATFRATVSAHARAVPMLARCENTNGPRTYHEVELQYRLRRAGFQGLRLRRFRGQPGMPETILSMAVRRACN